MPYETTFALALGTGQTGLEATLRAALIDDDGTIHATIRDISTGFTEIGVGNYHWNYTAFPVGYRGSAVFYVGTVGAGSDFTGVTVKSISAINPEEFQDIWTLTPRTLTQPAVSIQTTVDGVRITVYRDNYLSFQITGLGSIDGNVEVWFSAKKNARDDSDDDAQLRLSSVVGLERIAGAAGTAGNGTLIVDDATAGDVTMTLKAVESAKLALLESGDYDVKWKNAAGDVLILTTGIWRCLATSTRATS